MVLRTHLHSRRGAVLIVVVGVLALLSLMAATFGMLMSMERTAGRNQREYEMARTAAQAGLEYVLQSLPTALASGNLAELTPDPDNPLYSQFLYQRAGVKVGFLVAAPEAPAATPAIHTALYKKPWAEGVGLKNAGQFNLNGMGYLGDLGDDATLSDIGIHKGIHYTSFDSSLARLFKKQFDVLVAQSVTVPGYGTLDASEARSLARLLSNAIITYRYGPDGVPGTQGMENRHPENMPDWAAYPWLWRNSGDVGTYVSGHFWGLAAAGCTTTSLAADTIAPGWWREWDPPPTRWAGYQTYAATLYSAATTDRLKTIDLTPANGVSTLNFTTDSWAAPLDESERFAIIPSTASARIGAADTSRSVLTWPNGTLACEEQILPTLFDYSTASAAPYNRIEAIGNIAECPSAVDNTLRIDRTDLSAAALADFFTYRLLVVRIMDGVGSGQVRQVTSVTNDILTVSPKWSTRPDPANGTLADRGTLTQDAGSGATTLTDDTKAWRTGEHKGRWVAIGADVCEIISNSATQITFTPGLTSAQVAGAAYTINGQQYRIEYDALEAGTGSGSGNTFSVTLSVRNPSGWVNDQFKGCVVNIYDSSTSSAIGQTRLIIANTSNTLTLDRAWRTNVPAGSRYRIEFPQDYKYRPDNLQGDDRLYHSVAEILPIMVDALQDAGLTLANAQGAAAILYPAVKDCLTVSATVPTKPGDVCGINDPATDGLDNDDDGVVDNEASWSDARKARYLYEGLGLKAWVHADLPSPSEAERLRHAAQLVANIMDFRDSDHVPTRLTEADLGETSLSFSPSGAVFGYEGVRITEIMSSMSPLLGSPAGDGSELVDDGGSGGTDDPTGPATGGDDNDADLNPDTGGRADLDGWDWNAGGSYWEVVDTTDPGDPATWITGKWEYSGLRTGWYAIRINIAGLADQELRFATAAPSEGVATPVTVRVPPSGTGWSYVRDGTQLVAVHVVGGVLSFKITAQKDMRFYGFELLPQYISLTNCAAQDVPLTSITVPALAGPTPMPLPANTVIHGASADGTFPIRYGTFTIAMGQRAYANQWGADTDSVWGNDLNEDYPVFFAGDVSDEFADAFLLDNSSSPAITVVSNGRVIAQTGPDTVDGEPGVCVDGRAKEKSGTPWSASWSDWGSSLSLTAPDPDADLVGSQNKANAGGTTVALNSEFDALFRDSTPSVTYPNIKSEAEFRTAQQTLPVILNRPFPTPGWLGLVPTGNAAWRTIDYDPAPGPVSRDAPEKLLGLLLEKARVGGTHARVSLKTQGARTAEALRSIFGESALTVLLNGDSGTVTGAGAATLTDSTRNWAANRWQNYQVEIVSGAGSGQTRTISSNTATQITVSANWTTTPNTTSRYRIYAGKESGTVYAVGGTNAELVGGPASPPAPATWPVDAWQGYVVRIESGTGKGQIRRVISNTRDTLTVDPWTEPPDTSSTYRLSAGDTWDGLLLCKKVQDLCKSAGTAFGGGTIADDFQSFALTSNYANPEDDFMDEEFVRRYANLLDLRTTNLKYTVAGLVYAEDANLNNPPPPLAQVRIEVELDVSDPNKVKVVSFRYVTE